MIGRWMCSLFGHPAGSVNTYRSLRDGQVRSVCQRCWRPVVVVVPKRRKEL